jgi:hypothetical protein
MSDSFTEVTSESWFRRLGNAIKGVLLGIVLCVVAFPLLWWNEGRAVKTATGLKAAGEAVVSVSADKVDPAHDKQLVHMTAEATTDETLSDADFKFSAPAIKLRRRVEMYQWKEDERTEERKKLGGGVEKTKTYTYEKTWSAQLIESTRFKHGEGHENPASMRFPGREETAKVVRLGAFKLSPDLVRQITNYEPLPLDAQALDQLPEELKQQIKQEGNTLYLSNESKPQIEQNGSPRHVRDESKKQSKRDGSPRHVPNESKKPTADPAKPVIGDLRISFEVVKPAMVSILARQLGDTFEAWESGTGTPIDRLTEGEASAQNMLGQMERENTMLTWLLRGGGFLLMAFGLGMVFSPLAVAADVVPFLGDLLRMGVGLFAAVVAGGLSLVTIAVAWLAYRPVLGVGLMVLAGVLILGLLRLGRKKGVAASQPA